MKLTAEELRNLHNELWEEVPRTSTSYGSMREKRNLTSLEWRCLVHTIPDYVMSIHNTGFGFRLGFSLFEAPVYPGLPAEFLITVCQGQVPEEELQKPTKGNPKAAYDRFMAFAGTEKNLEALKHCGLDLPKGPVYYEY